MQLIPEAARAWRLASVQIAALAVIYGALPVDQQASILALLGVGPERIPAIMGIGVIIARLVSQPALRSE